MTDPRGPVLRGWMRRRAYIQKPRVSWCEFTRKWIVNDLGNRHQCGRGSYKRDTAFRYWGDAMAEANAVYRERAMRALAYALAANGRQ